MKEKMKNILSLTGKVGAGLTGLCALFVGIELAGIKYDKKHGRAAWEDEPLSSDVVVEAFNDGRVRVRNKREGCYTTPMLQWVSGVPERDSLTVFCDKDGRRGYLNVNDGRIAIPARFDKAWQFSEGLGAVLKESGKVGFIDREGKWALSCEIPFEGGADYLFKDGFCTVSQWIESDEKTICAVYDTTGRAVIPWGAYYYISNPNADGYRIARGEDGDRLYDRKFRLIFPEVFENVSFAAGNKGIYLTRNHVKQLVDYSGRVIEPFVIDDTRPLRYMVKYHETEADEYELVPDLAVYVVNNWEGLLDLRTGKPVTPAVYWAMEMVSKDLVRARLGYRDESVVMDKRGHVIAW